MIKINNSTNTWNYSAANKLCSIFIITFVFPTFWGYLSIGIGQIMYLLVTALASSLFIINRRIVFPRISKIFFFLFIAYSITLSLNMPKGLISLKDYTDIVRPFFYIYFFSIPLIVGFRKTDLPKIIKCVVTCSLVIVVIDLLKFVVGADPIIKLYALWERDSLNYYRFAGTFCYCYNYGFIIIFCLVWLLYSKVKHYKTLVGVCAIILLATGSRSVYLAAFLTIIIFFFRSKRPLIFKVSFCIIFVFSLIIIYNLIKIYEIPYLSSSVSYVENLVLALQGESNDGSLSTRTSQLNRALGILGSNPLIGGGPQKETSAPIEFQIGYYLSSWGLLGTFIFLCSMLLFYLMAYRASKCSNSQISNFSKANLLWIVSSFIVGMSTPITDQIRVFHIFYLIQGMQYVLYMTECRKGIVNTSG